MTHREYPDLRKLFLQWIFVERLVLFSRAQEFFEEITSTIDFRCDEENEKDINVFIDYCKKALNPVSLSLKKQLFVQADEKIEYIGICNIKSDSISQTATKFNAENINHFKKIIEISRNSSNHEFTSFNLEHNLKLSKSQVQSLVSDFVEGGWISCNKSRGVFYLGPRTLLELGDYLRERSDESNDENISSEFKYCNLCSSIISCGSRIYCNIHECKLQFHSYCFNEYCRNTGKSGCPICHGPITK